MRERIKKGNRGTYKGEKEVHLSTQGVKTFQAAFTFHGESWKKITSGKYVAIEPDWAEKRIYFVEEDQDEGYKLSGDKSVRTLALTIHNKEKWDQLKGDYNLLKDSATGDYYIDLI